MTITVTERDVQISLKHNKMPTKVSRRNPLSLVLCKLLRRRVTVSSNTPYINWVDGDYRANLKLSEPAMLFIDDYYRGTIEGPFPKVFELLEI